MALVGFSIYISATDADLLHRYDHRHETDGKARTDLEILATYTHISWS